MRTNSSIIKQCSNRIGRIRVISWQCGLLPNYCGHLSKINTAFTYRQLVRLHSWVRYVVPCLSDYGKNNKRYSRPTVWRRSYYDICNMIEAIALKNRTLYTWRCYLSSHIAGFSGCLASSIHRILHTASCDGCFSPPPLSLSLSLTTLQLDAKWPFTACHTHATKTMPDYNRLPEEFSIYVNLATTKAVAQCDKLATIELSRQHLQLSTYRPNGENSRTSA